MALMRGGSFATGGGWQKDVRLSPLEEVVVVRNNGLRQSSRDKWWGGTS
jgi:hypothetical protein